MYVCMYLTPLRWDTASTAVIFQELLVKIKEKYLLNDSSKRDPVEPCCGSTHTPAFPDIGVTTCS